MQGRGNAGSLKELRGLIRMRILPFTSLFPNQAQPTLGVFIYQRTAHLARRPGMRVEVVAPLTDPALVGRIRHEILGQYLADNVTARRLSSDGTYTRVLPIPGESPRACQTALLEEPSPGLET